MELTHIALEASNSLFPLNGNKDLSYTNNVIRILTQQNSKNILECLYQVYNSVILILTGFYIEFDIQGNSFENKNKTNVDKAGRGKQTSIGN